MTLKERIDSELVSALKARDQRRVDVLRMVKSKILEKEVDLRSGKGRDYQLNDEETLSILSSYAKQRKQSIESYEQGGRQDLADGEKAELAIVEEYLPQQLSDEKLQQLVTDAIAESGATSVRDMGQVMKLVLARAAGAADGKRVSELVRAKLG
jgi:uncharacterized protein YqeY